MTDRSQHTRPGRKHFRERVSLLGACALCFLACVPNAAADPIKASHEGCVSALPDNRATWTADRHFQFVAFWDPVSGCDPTIQQPIVLHAWIEDFDGTGGLKVETLFDQFPKCGRIQFDAQTYVDATSNLLDAMGLVSLVFDTKIDCASTPGNEDDAGSDRGGNPNGPLHEPSGFIRISDSLPDPTPDLTDPREVPEPPLDDFPDDPEWPEDPPEPPSVVRQVPEPRTALLVITALGLIRARLRRCRRRNAK